MPPHGSFIISGGLMQREHDDFHGDWLAGDTLTAWKKVRT